MVETQTLINNFTAINLAAKKRRLRVLICGDVIRDRCTHGNSTRLSPEYPVPVVRITSDEYCEYPGGAANLARQFAHWPVDIALAGIIDRPTAALLDRNNIDRTCCVVGDNASVPVKHRLFSNDAYLLRIDTEISNYGLTDCDLSNCRSSLFQKLIDYFADGKPDLVIISDYAKGVFDADFLLAINHLVAGQVVLIDPKDLPATKYGSGLIKADLAYHKRFGLNGIDNYVVTRGELPPYGLNGGIPFYCRQRMPVNARDTNGAGDCYLAHLAIMIGYGAILPVAAELAFSAGRSYVVADHNRPVLPHEILADLSPYLAKIHDLATLMVILRSRHDGQTVVLANGCFDLLHPGHLDTLTKAKEEGDVLIVAVNSDHSVRQIKGPGRPIIPCSERMEMVAALSCVDYVVQFDNSSPEFVIEVIKPDVLVKGYDSKQPIPGADLVKRTVILPEPNDIKRAIHTSSIISSLQ